MRAFVARYGLWLASAAAWVISVVSVVNWDKPSPYHAVAWTATICLTCWACYRHEKRPRLRPGERLVVIGEDERVVKASDYALMAGGITAGLDRARDLREGSGGSARHLHSA